MQRPIPAYSLMDSAWEQGSIIKKKHFEASLSPIKLNSQPPPLVFILFFKGLGARALKPWRLIGYPEDGVIEFNLLFLEALETDHRGGM